MFSSYVLKDYDAFWQFWEFNKLIYGFRGRENGNLPKSDRSGSLADRSARLSCFQDVHCQNRNDPVKLADRSARSNDLQVTHCQNQIDSVKTVDRSAPPKKVWNTFCQNWIDSTPERIDPAENFCSNFITKLPFFSKTIKGKL